MKSVVVYSKDVYEAKATADARAETVTFEVPDSDMLLTMSAGALSMLSFSIELAKMGMQP